MHRSAVSPWARLHLRWNPFGEPRPEDISDLIVLPDESEWLAHLMQPCAVLQFLGDAGRGKTARLRTIQGRFLTAPYVYLGEDEPVPPLPRLRIRSDHGPALLLDEAQRLPRRRRRRLFHEAARHGASLVIATHEDLSRELERAGLDVRSIVVRGLDEQHLLQITNRRIDWARLGSGAPPRLTPAKLRELIGRHGDDLRSLLDQLYDEYQDLLSETNEESHQWRNAI